MENTIKILCTAEEAIIVQDLLTTSFIKAVQNDPTWGLTGSGEYYVVYLKDYTLAPSALFELGMAVGMKKASNIHKQVFNIQ